MTSWRYRNLPGHSIPVRDELYPSEVRDPPRHGIGIGIDTVSDAGIYIDVGVQGSARKNCDVWWRNWDSFRRQTGEKKNWGKVEDFVQSSTGHWRDNTDTVVTY